MTTGKSTLTPKQKRFTEEYMLDLNSSAASIRAGYSSKTAGKIGFENLQKPEIQAAVETAMAERALRTEVSVDRTLKELARVGFSDVRRLFTSDGRMKSIHELDDDMAAAIASLKVVTRSLSNGDVEYVYEIKCWDKNSAQEKISRHLGMLDAKPKANDTEDPLTKLLKSAQGTSLPVVQNPPDDDDDDN